jgi:hypothetical protein
MSKYFYDEQFVSAEITTTNDVSIAIVRAEINGEVYVWTGSSKRFCGDGTTPADRANPDVGARLALSRAFANASRQLERQANGIVKSDNDNRVQAAKARKDSATRSVFRVTKPKRQGRIRKNQKTSNVF